MSSQARAFAYCLRGAPKSGGEQCSYNTRAQCMQSARGRGGSCVRNPRLSSAPAARSARAQYRGPARPRAANARDSRKGANWNRNQSGP
ncbi:DUF3551 domain-containing protein [Bradyrhizobium sp. LHD-71]|uniref:DUF3551 domain-containing protein n=1 Tax=Bradyrhizobium sp. LHD-71 TaxID=3072141 RepID=UPI0035BE1265